MKGFITLTDDRGTPWRCHILVSEIVLVEYYDKTGEACITLRSDKEIEVPIGLRKLKNAIQKALDELAEPG